MEKLFEQTKSIIDHLDDVKKEIYKQISKIDPKDRDEAFLRVEELLNEVTKGQVDFKKKIKEFNEY